MSMSYTLRKLAEDNPKDLFADNDEAIRFVGELAADEPEIDDPSESAVKRLGRLCFGLRAGTVRASQIARVIKTRRVVEVDDD